MNIVYKDMMVCKLRPRLHETETKSNRDENFQYVHTRPVRISQILPAIFIFIVIFWACIVPKQKHSRDRSEM
jgi:hypothetical protein